jgi:hypothetical protein
MAVLPVSRPESLGLSMVRVVEDCKSAFTRKNREWRRTKKMMLAFHGIEVVEVLSKGGA